MLAERNGLPVGMICEVNAFGRIHAGLIDLSDEGYRINGGVGWAIDGFRLIVRARRSSNFDISDTRAYPVAADELGALRSMLNVFTKAHDGEGASIEIGGDLPSHRGLGAGTALRLAMLEACAAIWGVATCPSELVRFSNRGGTSGIGVRTYFEGGLVVDLGHRRCHVAAPSRDRAAAGPALPLLRVDMPSWHFGLVSPAELPQVEMSIERAVFAETLPLSAYDARASLYEVIYGIVGGVLEREPSVFAAAVDALQKGRWKRAEWGIHGAALENLATRIVAAGAIGVGLSSMGPTLYFLHPEADLSAPIPGRVTWVKPVNRGRELRLIDDD